MCKNFEIKPYAKNVASVVNAEEDSLVFVDYTGERAEELIKNTKAKEIVTKLDNEIFCKKYGKIGIYSKNPRLTFLRIWKKYFPIIDNKPFIHPTAVIFDNVKIGKNVRIGAGTVVGCDGFNQYRTEEGYLERVPHIGGVIIEDDVEIQANSCICRATFDNTIIGKNTYVDNLVHIAHNCIVGKSCRIIAGAILGGSSITGDRCFLGINSSIRDGIRIGNDVIVGMGSVVIHDVPDNVVVAGNPAKVLRRH